MPVLKYKNSNGELEVVTPWGLATQTSAGVMSAEDKKKLDELEGGGGGSVSPATKDTLGGIKVGEFLEAEDDGTLNVVTSYNYDAGTTTATGTTYYGSDYLTDGYFAVKITSKYKIESATKVSWEGTEITTFNQQVLDDGTLVIWTNSLPEPGTSVEVTYTYAAGTKELAPDYTAHAGEFIEIDENNNINVVTSYDYDAGTITETHPMTDSTYDGYEIYIMPKYPISNLTSVKIIQTDNGSDYTGDTPDYSIQSDGRLYIQVDTWGTSVSAVVTYDYVAGTKSLIPETIGTSQVSINYGTSLPDTGTEGEIFLLI